MSSSSIFTMNFLSFLVSLFFILFIVRSNVVGIPMEFPEIQNDNSIDQMTVFRLPNETAPLSYKLFFVPLINGTLIQTDKTRIPRPSTFWGRVEIKIVANQVTRQIVLHAVDLNVEKVTVLKENGIVLEVISVEYSVPDQLMFVKLNNELVLSNNYIVQIEYYGTHSNRMKGFYQSVYPHTDGLRLMAATQFESTYARLAFPCYDEPKYRTTFDISIAVNNNSTEVISNMPLKGTTQDPRFGFVKTFETTPAMATYLVAFLVGKFGSIDTHDRVTVWTRENAVDSGKYIADRAPRVLKKLEEVTGVPYSLKKLDIAAIPDFAAGAMENWGLTTYRESRTLVGETTTTRQKRLVLEVVAHEFAHQWFGDLVTPVWWSAVWLNEAFATFYEYHITSMIEPTWRLFDFFVIEELQTALSMDGGIIDRPMTYYVNTPKEISDQFDVIIYNKGGSILRMLQHAISKPTFNKAITMYLKRSVEKSYGSVAPSNLMDAFEDAVFEDKSVKADISIMQVIKSWTEQEAYPLVTITRDYAKKTLTVSQSLYQHDGVAKVKKLLWQIPLTFTTKNNPNFADTKPAAWLTGESLKDFQPINNDDWIIFNIQQIGYYRVTYDAENWNLLIRQLLAKHEDIHVLNRAQIIDDVFHLAEDGVLSYSLPFPLVNYLIGEKDIIPWTAAIKIFNHVRTLTQGTLVQPALQVLVSKLIAPQYQRFGLNEIEGENFVTKVSRSIIVDAACKFRHTACVEDARNALKEWITSAGKKAISPDVMSTVLCTGISHGTQQEWDAVKKYYDENGLDSSLAEIVLPALGCTNNVALLQSMLELPFTGELPYRAQNNRYIYEYLSKHEAIDAAFNVIEKWLPLITESSKDETYVLLNIISSVGKYAQTEEHLKKLESIKISEKFKTAPVHVKTAVDKTLNRVKFNSERRKKHVALIKAELLDDKTTSSSTTSTEATTELKPGVSTTAKPSPAGGASGQISNLSTLVFSLGCILYAFKYIINC